MKQSHFFAYLSRLRFITRWPLMRNVERENVSEHSLQVAFVAHALTIIKNKKFSANLNAERIALLAMYHDAGEVLTGDMPSPIKYHNPQLYQEYKKIEQVAQHTLLKMLPDELREDFAAVLLDTNYTVEEKFIVKQADTLCAYIKALEELAAGNIEFRLAKKRLSKVLKEQNSPEATYFMETFMPSFTLSLDEISQENEI